MEVTSLSPTTRWSSTRTSSRARGLGQFVGDLAVGLAGFGDAGGVVVGEDNGGSVQFQAAFDHLRGGTRWRRLWSR